MTLILEASEMLQMLGMLTCSAFILVPSTAALVKKIILSDLTDPTGSSGSESKSDWKKRGGKYEH